jgi:hypothetical protein
VCNNHCSSSRRSNCFAESVCGRSSARPLTGGSQTTSSVDSVGVPPTHLPAPPRWRETRAAPYPSSTLQLLRYLKAMPPIRTARAACINSSAHDPHRAAERSGDGSTQRHPCARCAPPTWCNAPVKAQPRASRRP